eukprot:8955576-Pyramimonas_sp.AAC.1
MATRAWHTAKSWSTARCTEGSPRSTHAVLSKLPPEERPLEKASSEMPPSPSQSSNMSTQLL